MAVEYRIWTRDVVRGSVALDELEGFDDTWRLTEGEPLAATFPGDVRLTMNPDRPKNLLFVDNLYNPHRLIVASERLVAFLAARGMPCVEFLPVAIVDHRGRPAKPRYAIVHPVRPVDCLDIAAAMPEWSEIDPSSIRRLERLALDPKRVDPQRQLFRVVGYDRVVLVRADLADAIEAAGFTGVAFEPIDGPSAP